MANKQHLKLINRGIDGVDAWNAWRRKNPGVIPDLHEADLLDIGLSRANLFKADLRTTDLRDAGLNLTNLNYANLEGANLEEANLEGATLIGAKLSRAKLHGAEMSGADLSAADLSNADLTNTTLQDVSLIRTNLKKADLSGARLYQTVFGNTNLAETKGLDRCDHWGPSFIDFGTLEASGTLPLTFLRGLGLPESVVEYLPSLLKKPIAFYSCFISYSSKDQDFAERLYADLQNKGVRCWFAPQDLRIGAKTWDTIDEAIRHRDKVVLILSQQAIASDWVEDEVNKAFAEERERKQTVLFPIRLDDAVMQTVEPWARKLRDQRNIGDFTRWRDHHSYQKCLERMLRDLKIVSR